MLNNKFVAHNHKASSKTNDLTDLKNIKMNMTNNIPVMLKALRILAIILKIFIFDSLELGS